MYRRALAAYAGRKGLRQPYVATRIAQALLFDEIQEEALEKRAVQRSIERKQKNLLKKESAERARKTKACEKAIIQNLTETDWFRELVKLYFREALTKGIANEMVKRQAGIIRSYVTHPNQRIRKLSLQQGREILAELKKVKK